MSVNEQEDILPQPLVPSQELSEAEQAALHAQFEKDEALCWVGSAASGKARYAISTHGAYVLRASFPFGSSITLKRYKIKSSLIRHMRLRPNGTGDIVFVEMQRVGRQSKPEEGFMNISSPIAVAQSLQLFIKKGKRMSI